MHGDKLEEDADIVRSALASDNTLGPLVVLLDALDTKTRVQLETRSDSEVLDELRCLAAVRAELMTALSVEVGVGPFPDFDTASVVDWMLGPSTTSCRASIEKVMDLAARDTTRLFGDA